MKHLALGWACNLNDLFVRFPYEKCKSMLGLTKTKKKQLVKKVFRQGVEEVLNDIIENNVTFNVPKLGYYKGEIHMEPIQGEEFIRLRENGKFKDVDFLESLFTGYQMYLFISGKRDNFLSRRKFPIYISKFLKDKITKYTNEGKRYC